MKKPRHSGTIRKTALNAVAGTAIAFASFFSPDTALARGENCSMQAVRKEIKKEAEWQGKGRTCRQLKNLRIFVKDRESKRTIVVALDCSHVKKHYEESEDAFLRMLNDNVERGQRLADVSASGKWQCIGDSFDSPKPGPARRIMPDETSPDALPEVPKPAPEKPVAKKEGRWQSVLRFKTGPPILNNGKPYSPSQAGSMLTDNRKWIHSIFERVLKRDADASGKVDVRIIVGTGGKAVKVQFSAEKEPNAELMQRYADLFGRVRWADSGTIRFPLLLSASD